MFYFSLVHHIFRGFTAKSVFFPLETWDQVRSSSSCLSDFVCSCPRDRNLLFQNPPHHKWKPLVSFTYSVIRFRISQVHLFQILFFFNSFVLTFFFVLIFACYDISLPFLFYEVSEFLVLLTVWSHRILLWGTNLWRVLWCIRCRIWLWHRQQRGWSRLLYTWQTSERSHWRAFCCLLCLN